MSSNRSTAGGRVPRTPLGTTGLEVSRLCLGCMSFGEPDRGSHTWTLPEAPSRAVLKHALDAGIDFWDTANVYSHGSSEEIVGRALLDYAPRDAVVLATKVNGRMLDGPDGAGLSKRAIHAAIDASLKRLGTDHVDLYQIHRWDPEVPIEETLEALHGLVVAGKVRHLGASSMHAWQFAKAQRVAERNGWTPFATMQNHWNLLYREEEREMVPLCRDAGVAVIPWSPLARGRLARPNDATTERIATDGYGKTLYAEDASDRAIVDAVGRVAERHGQPRAQVALAWLLAQPGLTAPIVGATRTQQLDDAVAACSLALTPDDTAELEAPYTPRAISGH
jgi:aryl-alcohol dehydrogenase-like predicted oxidoreductase